MFESCLISGGHFVGSQWLKLAFSFKLIGRLDSYSSSGGGLNLIRCLFQPVSELKRYICSQYVEMEHTLAEKRRNLLRYTPKPHSHALNDVIMHKTHCALLTGSQNLASGFGLSQRSRRVVSSDQSDRGLWERDCHVWKITNYCIWKTLSKPHYPVTVFSHCILILQKAFSSQSSIQQ